MTGYTRQSLADIVNGLPVTAPPLSREFSALADAFNGSTGHSHDGGTGNAPKIPLTTSVAGYLPAVNGGTGGKHNLAATSNPLQTNDTGEGYAVGSLWVNTSTKQVFICTTATNNAAVWQPFLTIQADGTVLPVTHNTASLGTSATRFKDLFLAGTLTSAGGAAFTGTVTAGGFTGNLTGNVTGNVTGNLSGNVTASSGTTTITNLVVNGIVDVTNTRVRNVAAPTASSDAATKGYVDTAVGAARYLGASATDPTTDNDGNTLVEGMLYFNSSVDRLYVWNGSAWQAKLYDAANVAITGGTISGITDLAVADGGTGASTATAARTNLGLGSMATQTEGTGGNQFRDNSANNAHFLIEANNLSDLTSASSARTNLDLEIGVDVQAYDAGLASIAGLTTSSNEMIYTTGSNNYAVTGLSDFGRTLIDDAGATTARATLGLGTLATQNEGTGSGSFRDNSANDAHFLIEANNLSDLTNVGTARSNLGLGSMAIQNNTAVNIDGGTINGITDLAVADGGTGASTAANARTNLGLGSMATQAEGTAGSSFRDNAANDGRFLPISNPSISGHLNLNGGRLEWSDEPDGGDYIQWISQEGLGGFENGESVWRLGINTNLTRFKNVFNQTTAGAANVNVADTNLGILRRSTSTGAAKTNVTTVTDASAIDALRPVTFTSILPNDNPETVYMGFIAEEVAEACPCASMEDNYDQRALVALLVSAVKDLRQRVADLEAGT